MAEHLHLEDGFQSTVIVVEDDYIAIKVSYGHLGDRDRGIPNALMVYDQHETHQLVEMLIQAGAYMAGVDVDFPPCTRCGRQEDSWWSSGGVGEEFQ